MKMEGVEFPEALAMLAERAGIALEAGTHEPRRRRPGRRPSISGPSTRRWPGPSGSTTSACCDSPEAEPAPPISRRSAASRPRASSDSTWGSRPLERDWILQQAGGSPGRAKTLETIGHLGPAGRRRRMYDRFRGRALFSIRDAQGRPVGLGGRMLPESAASSPAKYVNSPETPLFPKSHLLYGLDLAREAIRKSRAAMVMEGYTDVIVAHQYGFQNAVAVLGTALGEAHVRILKRFADRIVLVLDGDEAGQKRANEVLELFVAQQVDLRILTLPDGLDPCDFLHQRGAEALRRAAGRLRGGRPGACRSARPRGAWTSSATSTRPARPWSG